MEPLKSLRTFWRHQAVPQYHTNHPQLVRSLQMAGISILWRSQHIFQQLNHEYIHTFIHSNDIQIDSIHFGTEYTVSCNGMNGNKVAIADHGWRSLLAIARWNMRCHMTPKLILIIERNRWCLTAPTPDENGSKAVGSWWIIAGVLQWFGKAK